ncbi:hypothetical protein OG735_16285 [Streptomyces sp. NBC_01210]|uniref:WXG100 family type VII secretion target n=1 Tax=Streptomyces sp. NBC_01210 TaxID=2903774 RepID=UPI002E0D27B8|nr:hypothetical protein OG735_16285 [Streptomyces sp. NBC_01210]
MGESNGKKPTPGKTPFDSMSQEQLFALLSPANKETAMTLAEKLAKASEAIHDIGEDLKIRVPLVKWEGEGADAFKEWAGQTAKATLLLGDYAEEAGKWMTDVAQAIAEAHSGLDELKTSAATAQSNYSDAKKTHNAAVHDPGAGKSAVKDAKSDMDLAHSTMQAARISSVQRLTKLSQTYTQSGEQINKLQPPTFPPPAMQLGDSWRSSKSGYGYGEFQGSSRSAGTGTTRSGISESSETRSVAVGKTQSDGETSSVSVARPERPVDMEIDSVATLPETHTAPPPATTINVPPVGRPEGSGPVLPGMIPPTFGGSKTGLPSTSSPGRALPSTRGVVPPGQAGINSRMPRDGIAGGRPVVPNTGRPTGGIHRGTVIGNENATARGPMGRGGMPGMHGGGPMGGAGQSGISGGRRLASETGGIVGGRPGQPGKNSARPFTPGGSGLVRGTNPNPSIGGAHPGEQSGERPDYLSEDEETWQQGSRRVVPPVID